MVESGGIWWNLTEWWNLVEFDWMIESGGIKQILVKIPILYVTNSSLQQQLFGTPLNVEVGNGGSKRFRNHFAHTK